MTANAFEAGREEVSRVCYVLEIYLQVTAFSMLMLVVWHGGADIMPVKRNTTTEFFLQFFFRLASARACGWRKTQ